MCLLFAIPSGHAQGVGTSGEIAGTITDSSGGVLPKATVNVVDSQTGLKRTTTTNNTGQFRVAGLSPATYDISAEMSGFATELRKAVPLAVGQTVISDFNLKPSKVATIIEVTDQPPVVETERGSQADTITQQYIADLPVDRRDYLSFTLLAPGVSDSTRLAGDQDYRVKQTPQSGLWFYASNGRGNSITVDGGETSGDSGGVRLTVNQDDVQEYQINRSNYAADLGAATGASINIVTKSGTNNLQGTVYGFSATMPWTLATHSPSVRPSRTTPPSGNTGLMSCVHPFPLPAPRLEAHLYWHESVENDPANRWLREEIEKALAPEVALQLGVRRMSRKDGSGRRADRLEAAKLKSSRSAT